MITDCSAKCRDLPQISWLKGMKFVGKFFLLQVLYCCYRNPSPARLSFSPPFLLLCICFSLCLSNEWLCNWITRRLCILLVLAVKRRRRRRETEQNRIRNCVSRHWEDYFLFPSLFLPSVRFTPGTGCYSSTTLIITELLAEGRKRKWFCTKGRVKGNDLMKKELGFGQFV